MSFFLNRHVLWIAFCGCFLVALLLEVAVGPDRTLTPPLALGLAGIVLHQRWQFAIAHFGVHGRDRALIATAAIGMGLGAVSTGMCVGFAVADLPSWTQAGSQYTGWMKSVFLLGLALSNVTLYKPDMQGAIIRSLSGRAISGRDSVYSTAKLLSNFLSPEDRVITTSFEDAPSDYVDESPTSAEFMTLWRSQISRLGIEVRHVVRVFGNKEDVSNLKDRINRYGSLQKYEIGVLVAPPPFPFIDLYLVREKYGMICISTNAATPCLLTGAIFVSEPTSISALCSYFDESIWPHAFPVKSFHGVSSEKLDRVESACGLLESSNDPGFWSRLPESVVSSGPLAEVIIAFLRCVSQDVPLALMRGSTDIELAREKIREVTTILRVGSPKPIVTKGSAYEALIYLRIHHGISQTLNAVSVLKNEEYWHSEAGRKQDQLETELCQRGVNVKRAFIVPSVSGVSTALNRIFLRQRASFGKSAVVVVDSSVLAGCRLEPDFAIVDSRWVIHESGGCVSVYEDAVVRAQFQDMLLAIWQRSEVRDMKKEVTVLLLGANPDGRLNLDEEVRQIEQKMRQGEFRDSIRFLAKSAVRLDDIIEYMNRINPTIVHFCGHGTKDKEVILLDSRGSPVGIGISALVEIFRVFKGVRVVVLNACYSEEQAYALVSHVDAAIGTPSAIGDTLAVEFAAAFYRGLSYGRSLQEAFEQATIIAKGWNAPEPVMHVREGLSAGEIRLL